MEQPMTADYFAERAMDFCSRNSFDRPPQVTRPAGVKRPVQDMSEDEQLQAAMRASLQDPRADDKDDDDSSVLYVDDGDEEDDDKPMNSKPVAPEPSIHNELLNMPVGEEPADGARIQIRMPDGKRVIRKFARADCVKVLYAFIAVRYICV